MPRTHVVGLFKVVWIFVAAALMPSRAEARPLALEDYYRLVTVQAPAMSPDGRWVAFIRTAIVEAENRREHFRHQMASQRAGYAASGVTPAEGTPLLVEVDQAEQAALDLARVKYAGEVRATTYQSEAQLYKWQARKTMQQGYIAAGASLLGGAATASSYYSGGGGGGGGGTSRVEGGVDSSGRIY